MGAILSPARQNVPVLEGLGLFSRGKVRDTYDLGGDKLLFDTTDGISIFDFVLNALVPQKGMILNAMTHFWLKLLEQYGISTHLVAAGQEANSYLPESLRGNTDLLARSMVVQKSPCTQLNSSPAVA
jgi:phosphoribosylaminoimidazole-succinocarboxamide synthase